MLRSFLIMPLVVACFAAFPAHAGNAWRYPDFDGDRTTDPVWTNSNTWSAETLALWRMDSTAARRRTRLIDADIVLHDALWFPM